MIQIENLRDGPLPDDMRILLEDYPRDDWEDHPHFHDQTKHWLGAHQMFRQLGQLMRKETENYLDKRRAPEDYAGRLSYYGDAMVRNLHGHHHWEDHSFFPELSAADARFDAGLEVLEKDHVVLDGILDDFTSKANRVLKLIQLDEKDARDAAGHLHGIAQGIEALLQRHLADEEDLVVPIILHHRLRG